MTSPPGMDITSTPQACAACGYNLAGLPTTTCPECGVDTIDAELAKARRLQSRKDTRRRVLGAVFVTIVCFFALDAPIDEGRILLMMALPIGFLFLHEALTISRRSKHPLGRRLLQYLVPAIGPLLIWICCQPARQYTPTALGYLSSNIALVVIVQLMWLRAHGVTAARILFSIGLHCFSAAMLVSMQAAWSLWHQRIWSIFDVTDRASGSASAVRNDNLILLATPWLALGLTLMLASRWLARRRAKHAPHSETSPQ